MRGGLLRVLLLPFRTFGVRLGPGRFVCRRLGLWGGGVPSQHSLQGRQLRLHRFGTARRRGPGDRLKSLYRSRGIQVAGKAGYAASKREGFVVKLPKDAQPLAELLYQELDALAALEARAKKAMLAEAKRHPEYRLVKSWRPPLDRRITVPPR